MEEKWVGLTLDVQGQLTKIKHYKYWLYNVKEFEVL